MTSSSIGSTWSMRKVGKRDSPWFVVGAGGCRASGCAPPPPLLRCSWMLACVGESPPPGQAQLDVLVLTRTVAFSGLLRCRHGVCNHQSPSPLLRHTTTVFEVASQPVVSSGPSSPSPARAPPHSYCSSTPQLPPPLSSMAASIPSKRRKPSRSDLICNGQRGLVWRPVWMGALGKRPMACWAEESRSRAPARLVVP